MKNLNNSGKKLLESLSTKSEPFYYSIGTLLITIVPIITFILS